MSQPAQHAEHSVFSRGRCVLWSVVSVGFQGSSKIAKAVRSLSLAFGAHFLLGSEGVRGRSIPGSEVVGTEVEKEILDLGIE